MQATVDMKPVRIRRISPDRYVRLTARERRNIRRARFVPPRVGSRGFGFFELVLKRPVYEKLNEQSA